MRSGHFDTTEEIDPSTPPPGVSKPESRVFRKSLFYFAGLCSLAAVFYLPYFIPQQPSNSYSWMFGYNNRAGVLILLAVIGAWVLFTHGLKLNPLPPAPARPLSSKWLMLALLVVICGCCAMYSRAGHYGAYNEANYLIERIWLLSQGKVPYADFEFPYGPLLLWGPLLLKRIFSADVAVGYYIFWTLNWILGTFLLFKLISDSNYPTQAKRSIFLTLFFVGLFGMLCLGTNYTFFRFVCPLFLISRFQQELDRGQQGPKFYSAIQGSGFTLMLLLISPETAIAFAFAAVCVASIYIVRTSNPASIPQWSSVLLLTSLIVAEFWAARRFHEFDTLILDGSGANSFPIFFAPAILLYIGSVFICFCLFYLQVVKGEVSDVNLGIIAVSIPMIAAALGRCDPGHLFWNGLGIFLASMFYISNFAGAWRRYRFWFPLLLVGIPWLAGFAISRIAVHPTGHRDDLQRSEATDPLLLGKFFPTWQGGFFAPFGFDPNAEGSVLSPRIDYGYFDPFINHGAVESIRATVREIEDTPERALILPAKFEDHCQTNPLGQQVAMSVLFGFPYLGHAVHTESLRKPICDYIVAHYRMQQPPAEQSFGYGLWVRK